MNEWIDDLSERERECVCVCEGGGFARELTCTARANASSAFVSLSSIRVGRTKGIVYTIRLFSSHPKITSAASPANLGLFTRFLPMYSSVRGFWEIKLTSDSIFRHHPEKLVSAEGERG